MEYYDMLSVLAFLSTSHSAGKFSAQREVNTRARKLTIHNIQHTVMKNKFP